MNDLRFAFRQFAKVPGFTAVAALMLALGIGVATALFSVVYGVLLDPYPYAKSSEIWSPQILNTKTGHGSRTSLVGDYLEFAKLPSVASAMATAAYDSVTLTGDINPEILNVPRISTTACEFLGVPPVIGRGIGPADILPNGEPRPVALLSFKLWQRLFHGDPGAVGRTIALNDTAHAIIGVMPPRFGWYGDDGLWLPLGTTDQQRRVNAIVRFKPGVTKEVAGQQFFALCQALAQADPKRFPPDGFTCSFINFMDTTSASGELRSSLLLLCYAVGFLLLIACTNVANLQLSRGVARSREIAVRLALGASRGRLVRQLMTESVMLALAGGLLGIFFAWGLTQIIVALMPAFYVPSEARVTLNGWVLAFSVGVSLATGILFGLAPGLQCTKPDLNETLKDGGHTGGAGGGTRGARTRSTLVVIEVALSIVLLVGASLAIRGFLELQRVDRGFRPERMLMTLLPLSPKRYTTLEQRNGFARDLVERLQNLPGVMAATVGILPSFDSGSGVTIPGQPKPTDNLALNLVGPNYLKTIGLALHAGRDLTPQEIAHGDHVALINEAAAKLWLNGESPLGRTILVDALVGGGDSNLAPADARKEVTVVGIVADTHTRDLTSPPRPTLFAPYTLRGQSNLFFMVRTQNDPASLLNLLRTEVRTLDREQALVRPITVEEVMGEQIVQPRFNLALFSGLAAIALALAAAGIYSVLSYSVAQRTREIGVRMALGAARGDILRLILASGGRLLVIGLVGGIAASIALAKIVTSQVFSVPLLDPLALAAAAGGLSVVALLACYLPARRATKVDPLVALRCE